MIDVFTHRSTIWVTIPYISCFGVFLRHFSNTFDMYQFLLRYEFTSYELQKALASNLPYNNRLKGLVQRHLSKYTILYLL